MMEKQKSSFQDKQILLTGGLGSLGQAQANKLVSLGANVCVLDRPEQKVSETAAYSYLGCDLSNPEAAEKTVREYADKVGGVDILINNAALIINKPFAEFSIEEYQSQLTVNSAAAFALTRACSPGMKNKKWGRIVNFTSLTLNGQWTGYVPYVASKGAMLGLTKSLARELGEFGITVNAVAPGAIVSEAEERVFGDKLQEYNDFIIEHQSLKKRIHPEHVADLVAFLVSDEAAMISGQNIGIDGGW